MRSGAIIYPLLTNYADLTALVPATKIFAIRGQQPTGGPYILYREISSVPLNTKGDSISTAADPRIKQRSILDTTRVQISVFAETYLELENIAVEVRNALDREWGAVPAPYTSQISLDSCVYESSVDDYDDDYGSRGVYIKHLDFILRINRIPAPDVYTNVYSLIFDGVDDYLSLGDSNVFTFGDGSTDSPFSVSLWAKINDGTRAPLFAKSAANKEYHILTSAADLLRIRLYDNSTGGYIQSEMNGAISTSGWSNYVFTYNGSGLNTGLKIYVNGSATAQSGSLSGSYTAMENTTADLRIGTSEQNSFYLDGNIDEFALFNIELSSAQVTAIYNSGTPTDLAAHTGLQGYWRMGDPTGTAAFPTITDESSNNNNGTMTNMTSSDITNDVP
tara:strand:+ start:5108 stop:6280 length:1173 start_codon:yes stop_codon:yes gene_type:complete